MKASISNIKLEQLLNSRRDIVVVDVRSKEEYEHQHIPCAINVPIEIIEAGHFMPESTKLIVTVCGKGGGRSERAANYLGKYYPNESYFLEDGTLGWFQNNS